MVGLCLSGLPLSEGVRARGSSAALQKWCKSSLDAGSCPSWGMSPCFTSKHVLAAAQGDAEGWVVGEDTVSGLGEGPTL